MVQVIFRNAVEDTTISVNVKGLYHVPLTKAEREWVYQILGCFVTKKFLENCIIQQAKLIKEETYYEKRKREKKNNKERNSKESSLAVQHVPMDGPGRE